MTPLTMTTTALDPLLSSVQKRIAILHCWGVGSRPASYVKCRIAVRGPFAVGLFGRPPSRALPMKLRRRRPVWVFVPWQGVAVATTIVIITFQMCIYPSDVYLDPLLSVIARARIRLTTYSYVCIRTIGRSSSPFFLVPLLTVKHS